MVKMTLKNAVEKEVEKILPKLIEISDWLYANPEVGSSEHNASKILSSELENHGFTVERGILEMDTAFIARFKGKKGGAKIALLAEYDALPGIGHACGHNIIGTSSVGAGIALSKIIGNLAGEIIVIGCPDEEGVGPYTSSKRRMADSGIFKDVDVAMMIHPGAGKNGVVMRSLAYNGVEITFKGRPAHASGSPEKGINALNAAVVMYTAVNANRQQLRRDADVVVHGIIAEGGLNEIIIPEKAYVRYGVRSSDDSYIPELVEMIKNSAYGAAKATGCEVDIKVRKGLKSAVRNKPLEQLFADIFRDLGLEIDYPPTESKPPGGSSDFANVTHEIPGIHPHISIAPKEVAGHSREFAEATISENGHKGLMISAKALGIAAIEILTKTNLLAEIKEAHVKAVGT